MRGYGTYRRSPPMTLPHLRTRTPQALVLAVAACGIAVYLFLKSEREPSTALAAVHAYLADVRATASGLSANTVAPAAPYLAPNVAPERLARCQRVASVEPLQTQGNYLRRWLQGLPPQGNAVSIDFADCLVRFYLRRTDAAAAWQVYRVHSHAG